MGYVVKNSPIGVDIVINDIIESMYEGLTDAGWQNYEAYHRAYKNPKRDGEKFIPEAYTKSNEYEEVLLNDELYSSSFFITGSNTTSEQGNYSVPLSVIFQVNLNELYKNVEHRADEEARNDAIVSIKNGPIGNKITSIVTDLPKVYEEFDTLGMNFNDMEPFHVFRVNMEVLVDYSCDYFCTHGDGGGFDYIFDQGMN